MVPTSSLRWRGWLVLAIIAGASRANLASAGFTIRDLGVIPGSVTSTAKAINASGEAAGVANGSQDGQSAVKSSGTGAYQSIPLPPDAVSSVANAISKSGNVGGTYTDIQGVQHGFATSSGPMVIVKPLMTMSGSGTYTQVNGINGSGQLAGTGNIPGSTSQAFVTTPTGVTTLIQPLGTGTFSQGNGINDSGVVVGTSSLSPNGVLHAFTANSAGTSTDLTLRNPGGPFVANSNGKAIANNGDVAGYGDIGQSQHAFFASAGGGPMVDLGVLQGATSSFGYGVNDISQVVGQLNYNSNGFGQPSSRAFLWDGANGMFDLNTLISSSDQSQWVLNQATGINDLSQISGTGLFDGVMHGFVLTRIDGESIIDPATSVPEPSTLVLSMIGLAILTVGSRRWKRIS